MPAETTKSKKTDVPGTVAQAFEEQAARTPESVALVSAERRLSYRELDERSNQLAHHLQKLSVEPETLVGICVERSLEMMVGLLAILKAGGAYVPMDPSYPEQRIALMIEDSEAQIIVATEQTKSCVGKTARHVVSMDGDAEVIAGYGTDHVSSAATEQNLAYVMYTSGSTGRPKGVMIEHHSVINFFDGMDQAIGPEPGVWLAVTSISFDISVLELFWTLARGFKVVIHGDEGTQTIPDEIRGYGVTHMQSTPSLARMVAVDPGGLASLGLLKKLLLGGEALPPSLVRQLRTEFNGELHNMYGPTETTIWSTTFQIAGEPPEMIPIGSPITKTQVYVLDSHLQRVEAGEPGDLYIGGAGVARGYWNRPDLNVEKFLVDPFLTRNCMYRTGDVARFLPDGNLEFLGRQDFQVKLRGHRIELGEIEAALENQKGVSQTAVVARQFKADDKRLVAYVVPKPGAAVEIATLREALSAMLPEYMVPSNFVLLEGFPLTANGKVDRNALPNPVIEKSGDIEELPRNEMERVIAQAWKDALEVESIGMEENFFDLGAHSLMVAEVHIQLQQILGREFSLVDLFQFPTVTALANHLKGAEAIPQISSRTARRLTARQQRVRGA
ncbi:MAG TPA: non-ribosomal peptide synthetase [Candidatus Saccharimonadales bacterium]|nr:non-ribosomal peptide synthetase [Candidatus Saccharimonadales bacterium]